MKIIYSKIFLLIISVIFISSCVSESEREALSLYKSAKISYQNQEYEETITKISKALDLTNDGGPHSAFNDGSVRLLLGRAYQALQKHENALQEYSKAIMLGKKFLQSHMLNSDPTPYAKRDFKRNILSDYYFTRAVLYKKLGKIKLYNEDIEMFKKWNNAK
ncbi:MAG: hypothetical protein V3W31_05885 [Thermodesulfobacteriota bacterium]